MGAKNHGVILPDANREYTTNSLVGAAFGAAGQRCMALSTAVMVGDAKDWLKDIKVKAEKLKINAGHEQDADLGPLISPAAKERVEDLIQSAVDEGAEVRAYIYLFQIPPFSLIPACMAIKNILKVHTLIQACTARVVVREISVGTY